MPETQLNNDTFAEIRIPVPWGHVAGRWYGDQMRRPVLALHGWLDNCGTYTTLAPLLAPHVSLLCIDLPGHGHSTHLPVGIAYNNLEYVRVILRLMQAYKWKQVSLLGHSMGGSTAFNFASLYPDRVDMIISIDVVKMRYFEPDLYVPMAEHIVEKLLISDERILLQSAMNEPPSYTFEECERLLYEGSERSVDLKNCKYILERNITKSTKYPDKYYFSRDGRIKFMSEMNPNKELYTEMALRICRARIPYLVIKGGASTNISAHSNEVIATLEQNHPHFEMLTLPTGTHHLHLNDPEPVAKLIIDFLQRHGTNKPPGGMAELKVVAKL